MLHVTIIFDYLYSFFDDYYCLIASMFGVWTSVFGVLAFVSIFFGKGFQRSFCARSQFRAASSSFGCWHCIHHWLLILCEWAHCLRWSKIVLTVGIFSPYFFFFLSFIFSTYISHVFQLTVVLLIDITTVEITIVARSFCCSCCFSFV